MGKNTRPSEARYRTLEKRQGRPKFGNEYLSAIFATKEEAPPHSRPCIVQLPEPGRALHALSVPELHLILLALHHPNLVEVHDQKVLSCIPCPHPAHHHPRAQEQILPFMRGTVDVADALGLLHYHPTVRVTDPDNPEQKITVPFPWIGDLLLFMEDAQGMYCVNWNIKDSPDQFSQPFSDDPKKKNSANEKAKVIARHQIEEIYYADAGIPTIKITSADFNRQVVFNLARLFGRHKRQTPFHADETKFILDRFRAGMAIGEPPLTTMSALQMYAPFSREHLTTLLLQAIWKRQIRVDLFEPIHLHVPLMPEKRDILDIHQRWFARG